LRDVRQTSGRPESTTVTTSGACAAAVPHGRPSTYPAVQRLELSHLASNEDRTTERSSSVTRLCCAGRRRRRP
jgi:hypothetical protein